MSKDAMTDATDQDHFVNFRRMTIPAVLEKQESRIKALEDRVTSLETSLSSIEDRTDRHFYARIEALENGVKGLTSIDQKAWLSTLDRHEDYTDHENRIDALEASLAKQRAITEALEARLSDGGDAPDTQLRLLTAVREALK